MDVKKWFIRALVIGFGVLAMAQSTGEAPEITILKLRQELAETRKQASACLYREADRESSAVGIELAKIQPQTKKETDKK